MNIDILAIGVHPDDIELCASGTLLKHLDLGYTVALCDLTKGELGSRGTAETRMKEAETARKIFGEQVPRISLDLQDGFFIQNKESILEIIQVLRYFRPKIVLANAVEDRHPDHARASKLISDACFYSGLVKIQTKWEDNPQQAWRPDAVYHYIQDRQLKPDFVVDITSYMDKKLETIMAYKTQFYDPQSDEPETPISSKAFIEYIKAKNRIFGRDINVDFAEGFLMERAIGVRNLFDLM